MALPDAAQLEDGRVVTITWNKQGTTTPEDISSPSAFTGTIESGSGPTYTTRAISGALAVTDGANGVFTWTWNAVDTVSGGRFEVQFVIVKTGVPSLRSFPEPWTVRRSP